MGLRVTGWREKSEKELKEKRENPAGILCETGLTGNMVVEVFVSETMMLKECKIKSRPQISKVNISKIHC